MIEAARGSGRSGRAASAALPEDLDDVDDKRIAPSVAWASAPAEGVPNMSVPIPGPQSLALMRRRDLYEFGDFPWVTSLPVAFATGLGVTLDDVDGNRYIDLTHGHSAAGLGHGNPEICDAVSVQSRKLTNVRNYPVEIRIRLMERLAGLTPGDLNLFAFYSSGTEACEGAMRAARAITGGHEFLSFYGDYHGKTVGAIATGESGSRNTGPRLGGFVTVPAGYCHRCEFKLEPTTCALHCLEFAERAMQTNSHGALAGIIIEPVTNGSGARVYAPGYLQGLRELADRNHVPLIFDEHASGMGRTGTWWAGDDEGVVPDIMFFGKYLGNGYPITCVAVSEQYRDRINVTSQSSTHGGQATACAAALATLDVMQRDSLVEHVQQAGRSALSALRSMQSRHSIIGAAQGKGYLLGLEFVDPTTRRPSAKVASAVADACLRRGVCTSPVGPALRVSPMIVASKAVVLRTYETVEAAVTDVEERA